MSGFAGTITVIVAAVTATVEDMDAVWINRKKENFVAESRPNPQCLAGSFSRPHCQAETLKQRIADLERQLEAAETQIRESQIVMQQFAHIYPEGFPMDWTADGTKLASQVTFLCNHQRTTFLQNVELIEKSKAAEADLKIAVEALQGFTRWTYVPLRIAAKSALDRIGRRP
jgi:hypothetical protein